MTSVLIAVRNDPRDLVLKLGDFGTSFELDDDGNPLSTRQAGTKVYWAPEIAEEATTGEGRITKWSTKSDIWGVGAVMARILTNERPQQGQAKDLTERCKHFQSFLAPDHAPLSGLLIQIISECLDPSADGRPSALQLLAVTLKSDTTPSGLLKSASFWKALSMHNDKNVIFSVADRFISQYLPLLARSRTAFNPKEVAIIMSLVQKHCPWHISRCHSQLCASFVGEFAEYTVFHALASVGAQDKETIHLAMVDSRWPEAAELSLTAIKTAHGLLPSNIAAMRQNTELCVRLAKIENRNRSAIAEKKRKRDLLNDRLQIETTAAKEFEFMFRMLTSLIDERSAIPASSASTAMTAAAKVGYLNVVQKLVEFGISPSISDKNHQTALHIFAHKGNLRMACFLLDSGAEIEARDRDSRTPLHWAAWAGQYETTRELLRKKADVNATDKQMRTALFGAAGGGYADVVQLLLSYKADQSIQGGNGNETALERAVKKKREAVIELLK
ncbi:ankyrin [Nemania sp. FL0916]|nr:ankyrin [Nemania sp. FL0916]